MYRFASGLWATRYLNIPGLVEERRNTLISDELMAKWTCIERTGVPPRSKTHCKYFIRHIASERPKRGLLEARQSINVLFWTLHLMNCEIMSESHDFSLLFSLSLSLSLPLSLSFLLLFSSSFDFTILFLKISNLLLFISDFYFQRCNCVSLSVSMCKMYVYTSFLCVQYIILWNFFA